MKNDLKEKIVEILTTELSYCYCDNCKFESYDSNKDSNDGIFIEIERE